MSTTAQTQPKKEEPTKQPEQPTLSNLEGEQTINTPLKWTEKLGAGVIIIIVILTFLLLIFFNLGASVLSYHKYGSYFWATINFFFAGLYYPFYAFFLDTNTPPVAAPTTTENMVGGVVKMLGGRRRSRKH